MPDHFLALCDAALQRCVLPMEINFSKLTWFLCAAIRSVVEGQEDVTAKNNMYYRISKYSCFRQISYPENFRQAKLGEMTILEQIHSGSIILHLGFLLEDYIFVWEIKKRNLKNLIITPLPQSELYPVKVYSCPNPFNYGNTMNHRPFVRDP